MLEMPVIHIDQLVITGNCVVYSTYYQALDVTIRSSQKDIPEQHQYCAQMERPGNLASLSANE
jgi:hypothetical protein